MSKSTAMINLLVWQVHSIYRLPRILLKTPSLLHVTKYKLGT